MIDPARILAAHPAPVPRYTSYPTAPQFQTSTGAAILDCTLAALTPQTPVSVYMHIPFCDRLCWFCGCHTKHTRQYAPVAAYMDSLLAEIALMRGRLEFAPRLAAVHLGGGSPSMLSAADMGRLSQALRTVFTFGPATEISVEIDPSDVKPETLEGLAALGITRASIGVQDFDPDVQQAINRPQSFEVTRDVVHQLRALGVGSINIDALYGLPRQTIARSEATMHQVVALQPERLALFGYAHVPWMKKHQQMIREKDLPGPLERFDQATAAAAIACEAGLQPVGFDHFARPTDDLAIAARTGRLHRNFQGYTTDACDVLIGFGASSIGRSPEGYVQNIVATGLYQAAVADGRLPALRGMALSFDDKVRAHMIERLMCDFAIRFDDFAQTFGAAAAPYIAEARAIALADVDGLCVLDGEAFVVPPDAHPFVRIVAARFDAYINASEARYSQAV